MKNKIIGCLRCGGEHWLNDRVLSDYSSGGEYTTLCPECKSVGFVSRNQLRKYVLEVATRKKADGKQ
jgi:hypothetical protein